MARQESGRAGGCQRSTACAGHEVPRNSFRVKQPPKRPCAAGESLGVPDTTSGRPDAGALSHLRGAIRAFVLSRVKDAALADDITQETLVRLHRKFDTLRAGEKLEAWVFQIARNALADHFRAAKPTETFDELAHAAPADTHTHEPLAAEEEALRGELVAYVRSVIETLPAMYRDALRLTEFEGLSQVELARRLGLSVSAAKSRVQRARAMVRAEMERCCRWETDRYGSVLDVQPKRNNCCDDSASKPPGRSTFGSNPTGGAKFARPGPPPRPAR